MYALKVKGRMEFGCLSKTRSELFAKQLAAFHSWKGCQSKGGEQALSDFMADREMVKLTIERIGDD